VLVAIMLVPFSIHVSLCANISGTLFQWLLQHQLEIRGRDTLGNALASALPCVSCVQNLKPVPFMVFNFLLGVILDDEFLSAISIRTV